MVAYFTRQRIWILNRKVGSKKTSSNPQGHHLSHPYFRFYFRFLSPFHDTLTFDTDWVLAQVKEGLRAFVGQTAFEEVSHEWVIQQGKAGKLPIVPDVVAINWHEKQILLGECKWGVDGIDRQIARELIEQKTPKVLTALPDCGDGWQTHHAIFARGGITQAAQAEMKKLDGLMVDLDMLDRDL